MHLLHELPYNKLWCFSDQRVTDDEMLYLKVTREASRPFDFKMEFFRNLRKVCLYSLRDPVDRFLEEVNQLTRLKVLMIEQTGITIRTLNSPSLEKLSLKHCDFNRLQLNTPNLNSLVLWNDLYLPKDRNRYNMEFAFPLKVKHLECINFTPNLRQLKNLETLVCVDITFDLKLNEFKSLARTELWSLNAFRMVQNKKRRLRRKNLQIIASGFDEKSVTDEPLENQDQFFCSPMPSIKRFGLSRQFLEKAESNRWNLTGSVPWKFYLDLKTLDLGSWALDPEAPSTFKGKIPAAFFNKFRTDIYLQRADFGRPDELDQSALVELAERCRPRNLCLDSRVSQATFERLCRIQSIKTIRWIQDIENLDCLLNLKNLEYLEISSPTISTNFICRMLRELKFLYYFRFDPNNSNYFSLYIIKMYYLSEDGDHVGEGAGALYTSSIYYGDRMLARDRTKYSGDLDELIKEVKAWGKIGRLKKFIT